MAEDRLLHDDVLNLVAQLQKLLKVINHSDPTAQELKHTLYRKYRRQLANSAERFKRRYHWNEFQHLLTKIIADPSDPATMESRNMINQKLLNDFEQQFIVRPAFSEFNPPDPDEVKERIRARQFRQQIKAQQEAAANKCYNREDIMNMARDSQQKRQASHNLQKIIAACKKIDLRKLEDSLQQYLITREKP
jgi:patatin-like phospholipase/acyl hydrolase